VIPLNIEAYAGYVALPIAVTPAAYPYNP